MSEIDDIGRDTGRTIREILTVARSWFQHHRHTHRSDAVRKLTRKERRELAEALRAQVGEQRIAAAWFTKRVHDYQREANAMQWQQQSGQADPVWLNAQRQRLAGIRYGIESTLHNTALTLEHRGQVVQALGTIDREPTVLVDNIFPQLDERTGWEARATAVRSEQWVLKRRRDTDKVLTEQRERDHRKAHPEELAAENAELRRRIEELEHGTGTATEPEQTREGKPFVAMVGPADVLHLDEHDYAAVPHQDRERRRSFGTRDQAYEWTLRQLGSYGQTSSRRGEDFTAMIRERGRPASGEVVYGPIGMVTDELHTLREQHQRRSHEQAPPQPPGQSSTGPGDLDRFAEIERRLKDIAADRDRLDSRVGILQRGLDAVTADRDQIRRKLAAAEGRIEDLKNRNQRLAAEVAELRERPDADRVAAERDRFKRERDEAVTKLAAARPARERYGSRERVEFDKLGDTQRWSHESRVAAEDSQAAADSAAREEFGWAIAEQMSADFAKVHGDIYDEPKLREFAREWLTNAAKEHRERKGNDTDRNQQQRNGIERSR
ncbi:hypothetical protein [Nocardia brasiliensis]|uniref:hypothetical protein n=1 Tax=Nocardia brasiliensis TaxID=37326 RepID=UPI0024572C9E|nr:hypothetical protein [Nocardia brasiliensis]